MWITIVSLLLNFSSFSLFQGVTVSVEIVDINDYTPTFDPDTITLTISEGSPLKSSRSLDLAVDLDSPQHGVKRFTNILFFF